MLPEIEEGEALFRAGEFDKAEIHFNALLKRFGPNAVIFNNLGVIAFQQNHPETARHYFQESLRLDPAYKNAMDNLISLSPEPIQAKESSSEACIEPLASSPQAETPWEYPATLFHEDPLQRISVLQQEAVKQYRAGRLEETEVSFRRLALMTRYRRLDIIEPLIELFRLKEDIPGIKEILKRAAVSALEQDNFDRFLELCYRSIYAESFYSKRPCWRYSKVDEDINSFIRLSARRHPLFTWVQAHRCRPRKPDDGASLRVGFVLEGLDENQAPIRPYLSFAEHHDRARFRLFVFSRWSLKSDTAASHQHASTAKRFTDNGCTVMTPAEPLLPFSEVDFLVRSIVQNQIDILVFQTVYFVPGYNFLSCLHPAFFQAQVHHQQPEHSENMDLLYAIYKPRLESSLPIGGTGSVMSHTKSLAVESHNRKEWGIPAEAVVLISVMVRTKYSQPLFWQEMERLLKRHSNVYHIAVGLDRLDGLLQTDPEIAKRIITPGYRKDVMSWLAMADIFVDSFPAGSGSSVMEAMQTGLAVVTFNYDFQTLYAPANETVAAFFVQEKELIAPYQDKPAWHRIMDHAISDPVWRKQMGRKMQERAEAYRPEQSTIRFFSSLEDGYRRKINVTLP